MSSVFFIGIGGAGMSTLALLAQNLGWQVSGSDVKNSSNIFLLRKKGIKVFIGHSPKNIRSSNPDLVVYSSVIKPLNCEYREAEKLHIPLLPRAAFLAQLISPFKTIAVAGTHGKTTTTSMIGFILQQAYLRRQAHKPAYVYLGGKDKCLHNKKIKKNNWIVLETDESDKSFLYFNPDIAVITNIDKDHLSNYNNKFSQLKRAFGQFIKGRGKRKWTIICQDDKNLVSVAKHSKINPIITYGFNSKADFKIVQTKPSLKGSRVDIAIPGRKTLLSIVLPLWGEKYLSNALAAAVAASKAGVSITKGLKILQNYKLPQRRREIIGKVKNILIVDDHADHPTEIKSTLASLKPLKRKIVAIYQPHRYTRMNMLKDKVGTAFRHADSIISLDIYPAFEKPIPGITGKRVFQWIRQHNPTKDIYYVPKVDQVISFISDRLRDKLRKDQWIILTLGPGSIKKLAPKIFQYLKKNY